MTDNVDLSIIIPAYMEGARLGDSLERLAAWLGEHDYGLVEIIIIEQTTPEGQRDETATEAAAKAGLFRELRLINIGPRRGKGHAVRVGMFEARGRYRLFMDADLATPLQHLDDVKALMDRGGSVGIAVRNLFVIHKGLMRKLMSTAANLMAQVLVVPGVKDTQCGFKVFEARAAEEIFGRMTMLQWSFDMEIIAIARKLHYKIEYFKTDDWHDPKEEGAGLVGDSMLKVALKGFWDPFKIRLNIWSGRYRVANYKPEVTNYKPETVA